MPVLPVVRLVVPCREARYDATANSYSLIEPIHTITMRAGISKGHRETRLATFVLLSDGDGPFTLSVEIWCSEAGPLFKEAPIVRSDPFRITIPHRLTVVELAFELVDVPMPRPGLYEFRIKADGRELEGETAFLRVLPGD